MYKILLTFPNGEERVLNNVFFSIEEVMIFIEIIQFQFRPETNDYWDGETILIIIQL